MNKKNPAYADHIERHILEAFLIGAVLFVLLASVLTWQQGKNNIENDAVTRLNQMKNICQKYDDYELGLTTKDLQAKINKANILKEYGKETESEDISVLEEAVRDQYLSGMIILDQNLKTVQSVNLDKSDDKALLAVIFEDQQILEILEFPQKVFADRVTVDGKTYEYAIVARSDGDGVLICYSDITELQNDKYELSLNNMLESSVQSKDEIFVVTDGENVISSNAPALNGLTVGECPITNVIADDVRPEDSGLIYLKSNGRIWYGKHDLYRGYYLYIFYRAYTLYSYMIQQVGVAFGIYIIVCMLLLLLRQRQKKSKMQQMEKEYYLINAIASIYEVNVLIHPGENTWEVILDTPKFKEVTNGIRKADQMLEAITEKLVVPSARENFRQFADPVSVTERMEGRKFLAETFETVNGKWYQALLVPQIYGNEKKANTVIFLLRNVSENKKRELEYQEQLKISTEQAVIANASKTDFLRRMSHDMRTPINGIRGMTDICMDNCENTEKVRECLSKIRTSSDFLLELINNVLDMSKIEAGETEKEQTAFDIQKVFEDAAMIISTQARELGIDFQKEDLQGEHRYLLGSPLNVQRIFQNIMSNAIKYNHPGGKVKVSLKEVSSTEDQAVFHFICADTGIGMSPEFQKKAFDIFAQEHVTARTTYKGCGLGLPIVKKTVELMGGTVDLISEEGKGTTFTVSFSLQIDKDHIPEKSEPEESSEAEVKKLQGIRILVAEDNELNLEIENYMLTEEGAEVTDAHNGKEAVDIFAGSAPGTYDVILMDIMMPVMNGLEAARAIRELNHPDAEKIPIIAVSANAFADDIKASRESGMNDHLSKPIDYTKVTDVIRKYVNK